MQARVLLEDRQFGKLVIVCLIQLIDLVEITNKLVFGHGQQLTGLILFIAGNGGLLLQFSDIRFEAECGEGSASPMHNISEVVRALGEEEEVSNLFVQEVVINCNIIRIYPLFQIKGCQNCVTTRHSEQDLFEGHFLRPEQGTAKTVHSDELFGLVTQQWALVRTRASYVF